LQALLHGWDVLGAICRAEAHEVLIAMNRIGGKSTRRRWRRPHPLQILDDVGAERWDVGATHLGRLRNGDTASSSIKQVAAGRFGVTPVPDERQNEIKIAQGCQTEKAVNCLVRRSAPTSPCCAGQNRE